MSTYIPLTKLDVYIEARAYSKMAWDIYSAFDWEQRKIIGHQMIRAVDSVGANIAEGYGRYHYLDKNKFYYNARGSLLESRHWFGLLFERNLISNDVFVKLTEKADLISSKLNSLISSQYRRKQGSK